MSLLFLTSPAFYLASLSILREGQRPVRKYAVYFAPPVFLAIASSLYHVLTLMPAAAALRAFPGHFSTRASTVLIFLSVLAMTSAICGDLVQAHRIYKSGLVRHRGEFFGQVAFLACYLAATLFLWTALALRSERLIQGAFAGAGAVAIAFSFTRTTVFYATQAYAVTIRPAYVRPEWEETAALLTSRLAALMETSAPYRDPDLTLQKLARLVEVDPKRLSYHLHANLSTSFRAYVNERRLEAVGKALLDCPDRSILETAFANGFNSKSSFNTLFVQKYGMTPKEYKKKHGGERTSVQRA